MSLSTSHSSWVFGYGSLIYKVDFPYLRREVASTRGWQRRFWQGSHDHRGTPQDPGRVVTLVPAPDCICMGVAYLVENTVLEHLDYREKNGYQRHQIRLRLEASREQVDGLLYVASPDNFAFLGPAPAATIAAHIARASGPSGSNRDYLLQLAAALREIGVEDEHVHELEDLLLQGEFHPETHNTNSRSAAGES